MQVRRCYTLAVGYVCVCVLMGKEVTVFSVSKAAEAFGLAGEEREALLEVVLGEYNFHLVNSVLLPSAFRTLFQVLCVACVLFSCARVFHFRSSPCSRAWPRSPGPFTA